MSCERQGLPILPLRRALVPDTRPECITTVAGSLHISAKMGLRTYNEIRKSRGLQPYADARFDEPILPLSTKPEHG